MEAAAVNTVPPGGKALVLNAGYFAARWGNICKAFGINAVLLDTEWGQPVDPDQVAEALRQHPDTVCVHGHPERDLDRHRPSRRGDRQGRRRDAAVFAVDGISGVGAMECRTDDWGIDMLCVGSQKALMLPPGLAFVVGQPQGLGQDRRLRLAQLLLQPQGRPQEDQGVRHALHARPHLDPRPASRVAADQGRGDRERLAAASEDERGVPGRRPGARARALQRPARRGADGVPRSRGVEGYRDPQHADRAVRHHDRRRPGQAQGQDRPRRPHGLYRRARRRSPRWPRWRWCWPNSASTSSPGGASRPRSRC